MKFSKQIFCILSLTFFVSAPQVFAGDLDTCISNYCSYSCGAVSSCGYLAHSKVSACKRDCKPSAKSSINKLAKSKRLNSCKNSNKQFHKLTCSQIGTLLGVGRGGGSGNTKRSLHAGFEGYRLGSGF